MKQAGFLIILAVMLLVYFTMMIPSVMLALPFAAQNPGAFRIGASFLLTLLPLLLL